MVSERMVRSAEGGPFRELIVASHALSTHHGNEVVRLRNVSEWQSRA
jgi:hypothetical protein